MRRAFLSSHRLRRASNARRPPSLALTMRSPAARAAYQSGAHVSPLARVGTSSKALWKHARPPQSESAVLLASAPPLPARRRRRQLVTPAARTSAAWRRAASRDTRSMRRLRIGQRRFATPSSYVWTATYSSWMPRLRCSRHCSLRCPRRRFRRRPRRLCHLRRQPRRHRRSLHASVRHRSTSNSSMLTSTTPTSAAWGPTATCRPLSVMSTSAVL